MLNNIIQYSLKNRLLVIVVTSVILIAGAYTTVNMEIDVFPDLNAPTVVILTNAPGMAPEEVEQLVTFPIETGVNGATGIRRVRSSSSMGFSIVWVEFDWKTDVYNARQIVSEKLMGIIEQLPANVGSPILAPQSSIMGEIMIISLTADTTSSMDLHTIAEWTIRPRLLTVGGVAQVTIIGGENKQYQIFADPMKMKYFNVSLSELIDACNEMNENASGGFINEFGGKYLIRGIVRTNNVEELGNTVVKMVNNFPVKINDVAKVQIGAAPQIGDAAYNNEKAVIVTITKQPSINTLDLSDNIKKELEAIQKNISSDIIIHNDIFDQASFIKTSINNVQKALIEGGIFVVIILFIFLLNYRTTLISLLAIPISLLISIITMKWLGFTINTMSLGGMAIAIGSLVDDAIIDVENVYKRLRQNNSMLPEKRKNVLVVVYEASKEIRASILNATIIIIIAFIPLFFLSGMEGRMLQPLGVAYIVSLAASLLVALTLTPVLCSYLLTNEKRLAKRKKGSWVERKLIIYYEKALRKLMNYKKTVVITALVLFIGSIIVLLSFGRSFLPPFNEGALTINTATIPGISLEESKKIGSEVDNALLSVEEINIVARRTGRAELAEHSFDVNSSEIDVPYELTSRSRSEFLKEVRQKLSEIKGTNVEVGQPISHRIDAMLSGSKANIAIKIFGAELEKLYQIGSNIKNTISTVEGIGDIALEQQIEIPQIQIKPRRDIMAKFGISMNDFIQFIRFAFGGEKVSDVYESEKAYDLILRYDDKYRDNIEVIRNAIIDTHDGKKIPLHYIADIKSYTGPNTINRENVQRKIVLSVNVADRDVRGVVNDIQDRISTEINLPENYRIEYGGQFESEQSASRTLLITSLLAILIIFVVLFQEFRNTVLASVILVNLPLALIGGVGAIWITSGILSIPAIIGFITLFGIATRNGILLVSRYQNLKSEGKNLYQIVVTGSTDRLNPWRSEHI